MNWRNDKGMFMQSFQALDYQGLKGLLRENPGQVDAAMLHRLRYLKVCAAINSLLTPWDQLFYSKRIAGAVPPAPVFLLGHWRSGTTFLHNILSRDPQFGFPTLTQVFTPKSFLTLGRMTRAYLNRVLPEKRAMDQVVLGADEPQEDEFAVAVMCRLSPYLEMVFPRRRDHYCRYMPLEDVAPSERQTWKDTFLLFLKKMSLIDKRPMLLKSPPHTARIGMLGAMFPKARFIHIVRDPYRVYQSMWKLYDNYIAMQHLQVISRETARDNMLRNYNLMFNSFLNGINPDVASRLVTVHYEDLVSDPMRQIKKIYSRLKIEGFERVEPVIQKYIDSLKDYRPNPVAPLERNELELINRWCGPVFEEWGYAKKSS